MRFNSDRAALTVILSALIALTSGCCDAPNLRPATMPVTATATQWSQPVVMSASTTAPAIAPPSLQFSNQSIRDIQAGTKTATVRKGVRSFPAHVLTAISSGGRQLTLANVATTNKKLSELTEDDARANGSDSLEVLKAALARDYPGIDPEDVVTVITFRLAVK